MFKAADRGARVRLLADHLLLAVKDGELAALSGYPNRKIRILHPDRVRESTLIGTGALLLYFRGPSQRMRHILFVVGNYLTIR